MCISFSKVVLDRAYRGAKLRVFTSERIGMIDYFLLFFGKLIDYEKYPPMHGGYHSLSVLSIDPIYAYHNSVMENFFGRLKVRFLCHQLISHPEKIEKRAEKPLKIILL